MKPARCTWHTFRNVILPAVLLVPLIWLMAGCLYIPFFEHRLDSGPNVRALVGPVNSGRPIRPGNVSRGRVMEMLGNPNWTSDDGSAIGYTTYTGIGSWVWPLCFTAVPADNRVYAVRLVFDKNDTLIRYDWADAARGIPPLQLGGLHYLYEGAAMDELNQTAPVLIDRRILLPSTQP
jgi:hypothetical protein